MTSEVTFLTAPAKINLTLHVTGQLADGYHLLDSLVCFAGVGDWIEITPAAETSLTVMGPFADGVPTDARNLIWKAIDRVGEPHHIVLKKYLPNGAGIGGGSADAAAVLRQFGLTRGAEELGADVPVCLFPVAQRMRGVGNILERVMGLPLLWTVLVNPGCHVATPQVFHGLTSKQNPPMPEVFPNFADADELITWLAEQRNDLEGPAQELAPEITKVLDTLRTIEGSKLARMSGSGATCFALFSDRDAAQAAGETLATSYPNWWVQSTILN